MRRLTLSLALVIAAACGLGTQVATPKPPAIHALTVRAAAADGSLVAGAEITEIGGTPSGPYGVTGADGSLTLRLQDQDFTLCAARPETDRRCVGVVLRSDRLVIITVADTPRPTHADPAARTEWRASFATHNDRHGTPVFDPFWSSLPESRRSEWLEDKIARGLTHLVLSRAFRYPRYEARTGFAGSDGLDGATLAARVHEAYQGGLWPIVWLYDDDADGQAAVYDGRMRAMAEALVPVADELGGLSPAWEIAGTWSAKAVADAGQLLYEILGVRGVPLILHGASKERCTGASYPVEPDDPSRGDEAGWWYVPGADKYTDFFWQSRHGSDGPSYSDGNADPDGGTWLGRALECFERFAPPGTHMPALGRDVRTPDMHGRTAPDWFAAPRAGGRVRFTPFELEEYEDVTDEISDARITHVADRLASFGFTRFGSGIPSEMQP